MMSRPFLSSWFPFVLSQIICFYHCTLALPEIHHRCGFLLLLGRPNCRTICFLFLKKIRECSISLIARRIDLLPAALVAGPAHLTGFTNLPQESWTGFRNLPLGFPSAFFHLSIFCDFLYWFFLSVFYLFSLFLKYVWLFVNTHWTFLVQMFYIFQVCAEISSNTCKHLFLC